VLIVEVLVAAAVLAGVAAFVAGHFDPMAPASTDEPEVVPAGRELRPEDLEGARLRVALRGYRMDQVDLLLERAAQELRALRPARDATPRHATPPDATPPDPTPAPAPDAKPAPEAG
jgi:DivIVA domain-containing protein